MIRTLGLLSLASLSVAQAPPTAPFRYVAADEAVAGAKLRAMRLDDAPAADLEVQLPASAGTLRYGQLRFGVAVGTRVAFAIDHVPGAEPLLYVDQDRDRKLTGAERVRGGRAGFALSLRPRLDAKGKEGEVLRVLLRIGAISGQLGVATLGCMEGEAGFGDRRLLARRFDGDGNGLFADAADWLWLDLDGDRREDPVRETFPYRGVLSLDGKLCVVRGDEAGATLTLAELRDRGAVRVGLPGMPKPIAFAATLASDDGIVIGIAEVDADVTVPAGRYRLTNLQLTLPDGGKDQSWSYVFAEQNGGTRWEVARDAKVVIEPCEAPLFRVAVEPPSAAGSLVVRPSFTLGTGVYLVTCFRGDDSRSFGSGGATVTLVDGGGKQLASSHSGFA
ncbi:MAG TPA: hypothetical protein VF384_10085 [Planctomycetota bacterium]